jgi:hypothetical protein
MGGAVAAEWPELVDKEEKEHCELDGGCIDTRRAIVTEEKGVEAVTSPRWRQTDEEMRVEAASSPGWKRTDGEKGVEVASSDMVEVGR